VFAILSQTTVSINMSSKFQLILADITERKFNIYLFLKVYSRNDADHLALNSTMYLVS